MADLGTFPMPADLFVYGILACILISYLRLVLESNFFIRLAHAYDAKLLLAEEAIERHVEDCKESSVDINAKKIQRLKTFCDTRQKKFCECCWRILIYVALSVYGLSCIHR